MADLKQIIPRHIRLTSHPGGAGAERTRLEWGAASADLRGPVVASPADRWVSMSNIKHEALRAQGIEVVEQVAIPEGLVPLDAQVEIAAKKAAGYFAPSGAPSRAQLRRTKGRRLGV